MRYLLFVWFLFAALNLGAQSGKGRINYRVEFGDTSQVHQLVLLDYSRLLGTAVRLYEGKLYFRVRAALEDSVFPMDEVRYVCVFETEKESKRNQRRRYAAVPPFTDLTYERTALPLHGKGQVRVVELFYAVAEYNTGKNVQLGVGLAGPLGVLFTQKVRFSLSPIVHVGVSGQELWAPIVRTFEEDALILGEVSGMITLGTDRRFVHLSSGILFNSDDNSSPRWGHRFGVGGGLGKRWHLYGEFMVIRRVPEKRFSNLTLIPTLNASFGMRRHRWKFGFFTLVMDNDAFFPPPIPYVGYSFYW